jgi:hypothetical protein
MLTPRLLRDNHKSTEKKNENNGKTNQGAGTEKTVVILTTAATATHAVEAEQGAVVVQQGAAAVEQGAVVVEQEVAPVEQEAAAVGQGAAVVEQGAAVVEQEAAVEQGAAVAGGVVVAVVVGADVTPGPAISPIAGRAFPSQPLWRASKHGDKGKRNEDSVGYRRCAKAAGGSAASHRSWPLSR